MKKVSTSDHFIIKSAKLSPTYGKLRFTASFATSYLRGLDLYTDDNLGQMVVVAEILSDSEQAEEVAKIIIETAAHHYFDNPVDKDSFKNFEASIGQVNKALSDYAQNGFGGWVGKIGAVIAILKPDELFLAQAGSATAHLHRATKVITLTKACREKGPYGATKTFENVIKGPLQVDDKLLFATSNLSQQISKGEIESLVVDNSPTEAVAKIANIINLQRQTDRIAIVVSEVTLPETTEDQSAKVETEPDNLDLSPRLSRQEKIDQIRQRAAVISRNLGHSIKHWLTEAGKVIKTAAITSWQWLIKMWQIGYPKVKLGLQTIGKKINQFITYLRTRFFKK